MYKDDCATNWVLKGGRVWFFEINILYLPIEYVTSPNLTHIASVLLQKNHSTFPSSLSFEEMYEKRNRHKDHQTQIYIGKNCKGDALV